METDADRLASIKGLGGQLVRHDDGEFWAIFDNNYQAALDDGSMDSLGPALTCRTSDVANLRRAAAFDIAGTAYKLSRVEPDGTGMSVLFLTK